MSESLSQGVVDAGRWSGVAAAMAEYLDQWLSAPLPSAPPRIPAGTVAGAQRFFQQVLEGAALDRRERIRPEIPVMAGLSNWTIALDVLTRLPESRAKPEQVAAVAQRYLDALAKIRQGQRDGGLESDARAMREFFLELLKQGTRRRQSDFAAEESPVK